MAEIPNFKNYVRKLTQNNVGGKFEIDLSEFTPISTAATFVVGSKANRGSVLNGLGWLEAPSTLDNNSASSTQYVGVPFSFDNDKEYTIVFDWTRNAKGKTWAGVDKATILSMESNHDVAAGYGYTLSEYFFEEGKDSGTALVRVGPDKNDWNVRVSDAPAETYFSIELRGDMQISKIHVAEGDHTTETIFLNGVGVGSDGNTINIPRLSVAGKNVQGAVSTYERMRLRLRSSTQMPGKILPLTPGDTVGRLARYQVGRPELPWDNVIDGVEFEYGLLKITKPGRYRLSVFALWTVADHSDRVADLTLMLSGGEPNHHLVPIRYQDGNSYLEHQIESDVRYIAEGSNYAECYGYWSQLGNNAAIADATELTVALTRVENFTN